MAEEIDFTEYEKDLFELATDRRLPHLRKGDVRCSILTEEVRQAQELYDQVPAILEGRTIAKARQENLNILGRLVGQERLLVNQAEIDWFAPDLAGGAPDTGEVWVVGAPLFGDLPAADDEYRRLIESKIFKNHTIHGSIPEVIQFAKLVYGIDISVRKYPLSDIDLILPSSVPQYMVVTLSQLLSDVRADNQYFLPLSPTVRIKSTILKPVGTAFAPDSVNGPDVGELSIGIPN